jgi:ribosomal protein S18 acetylase RimI-like enzyme
MTEVHNAVRVGDPGKDEPFIVRNGQPEDAEELSLHWGDARAQSQQRVLERYFGEVSLGIQGCQVAVCQSDKALVGQLWTRFHNIDPAIADSRSACYMHTLFVLERYRCRGVARALVASASALARHFRRSVLVIGVDRPNQYARRLYETWGFQVFYETNDLRGDLIFLHRGLF